MAAPKAIRVGHFVAVCMVPETAPSNCYIGVVNAADEYGIRVNPVRWDKELDNIRAQTEDIFIPWVNINSMLVCAENEPEKRFIRDRAPAWQVEVEGMYK